MLRMFGPLKFPSSPKFTIHSQSSSAKFTQADLLQQVPASLKRTSEKGSSSWLTVLSLQEHGFSPPFMMPLLSGVVGSLLDFLSIVLVGLSFQLNTDLHAQREDFLSYDTMKSMI